jgi:hypothetical protein
MHQIQDDTIAIIPPKIALIAAKKQENRKNEMEEKTHKGIKRLPFDAKLPSAADSLVQSCRKNAKILALKPTFFLKFECLGAQVLCLYFFFT